MNRSVRFDTVIPSSDSLQQLPQDVLNIWNSYPAAPADHTVLLRLGGFTDICRIVPDAFTLHGIDVQGYLVLPLRDAQQRLTGLAYLPPDPDGKPIYCSDQPNDNGYHPCGGMLLNTDRLAHGQPVYVVSDPTTGFMLAKALLPVVVSLTPEQWRGSTPKAAMNLRYQVQAWSAAGQAVIVPVDLKDLRKYQDWLSDTCATVVGIEGMNSPSFYQPLELADLITDSLTDIADKKTEKIWCDPQPIKNELPPVKTLQGGMLPRDLEAYIFDQADRVPMPPDMVAVSVLTALCSLLGARVAIKPKKYDDFAVVPNLWGAFIAPPSSKKSGAFSAGMKPLDALAFAAQKRFSEELAAYELSQKQAKMLDKSEDKARNAQIDKIMKTEGREAAAAKLAELEKADREAQLSPPVLRRYKTNDSTVEALAVLEQNNPNGILVCRDELTGLLAKLDQEGNADERTFYLEGWNGDAPKDVDRIMRGHGFIENHCLSILGGIQPDKLIGYLEPSIKGLGNDGLIQRFQLMVYPDPIQWRFVDRAPNTLARDVVYAMFEQVDSLTAWDLECMGARPADTFNKRPYFRFSQPAYQYYEEWVTQLETVKIASEEHTIICEHLSKYNKLMPALALLFHVIDGLEMGHVGDVTLRAAEMAAEWCNYLESHARRVYSLVIQNNQRAAAILAEKIMQMGKNSTDKTDKTPTDADWVVSGFTARQVIRRNWKGLTTPEAVQNAIEILVEDHWLWMQNIPATVHGGRPTQRYWINPKAFS